jgi:hypothetical protein
LESCKQVAASPAHVITIGPKQSAVKRGAKKYEYYDNSSSLSPSSSMEDLSPGSFTTEEDLYNANKYELDLPKSPRHKNLAASESKKVILLMIHFYLFCRAPRHLELKELESTYHKHVKDTSYCTPSVLPIVLTD